MLSVFAIIIAGVVLGRVLSAHKLSFLNRIITVIIWALLFMLGVEVGSNPEVVRGFATLGWSALIIFGCSVAGSIAASWLLWRYLRSKNSAR